MNPSELPPLLRDPRRADADQLRPRAVPLYVLAGLPVVGLLLLGLHWSFLHVNMSLPSLGAGNDCSQWWSWASAA